MPGIYLAVDGDDVGRQLEYFMLVNNAEALVQFSASFREAMNWLEQELIQRFGATILFSGGDNLSAYIEGTHIPLEIYDEIRVQFNQKVQNTISLGLGTTLRQAYFALKLAKAAGKNCLRHFEEFIDE